MYDWCIFDYTHFVVVKKKQVNLKNSRTISQSVNLYICNVFMENDSISTLSLSKITKFFVFYFFSGKILENIFQQRQMNSSKKWMLFDKFVEACVVEKQRVVNNIWLWSIASCVSLPMHEPNRVRSTIGRWEQQQNKETEHRDIKIQYYHHYSLVCDARVYFRNEFSVRECAAVHDKIHKNSSRYLTNFVEFVQNKCETLIAVRRTFFENKRQDKGKWAIIVALDKTKRIKIISHKNPKSKPQFDLYFIPERKFASIPLTHAFSLTVRRPTNWWAKVAKVRPKIKIRITLRKPR